jgi:hypothetical protein
MSVTDHPQGIKNEVELVNTRTKLARLEKRYDELSADTTEDRHVRELTMRSLKGTINQFKEEIARYEAATMHEVPLK